MPDFLGNAETWLDALSHDSLSEPVTLRVGAAVTTLIPATIGNTEYQESNDDGLVTNSRAVDFLIAAADYEIDGQAIEPEAGHVLERLGKIYEVMAPGDEPAARFSGPGEKTWRIHTKLICS